MLDLRGEVRRALQQSGEPGCAELCDALDEMLDGEGKLPAQGVTLRPIKRRVLRLQLRAGEASHSYILKRVEPRIAQINRLAADRWLPALGLSDHCARLLATAAERRGLWTWQIYDDIGEETLARRPERSRLEAAVEFIAELHVRAGGHPLLLEVRQHGPDCGMHFFRTNIGDAIRGLEALSRSELTLPPQTRAIRSRLLERFSALLADAPRRERLVSEAGGPETMLHGDLFPKNVFVTSTADGLRARLIDWDHVGIGPWSFDLSTFLLRSPPGERSLILSRYREVVARAGWRMPGIAELNLLTETAECARSANELIWSLMALLEDGAEWAHGKLAEIDGWLSGLRPVLDE